MRAWLTAFWELLRELSGETALERRRACGCSVEDAWSEMFGGVHRCC